MPATTSHMPPDWRAPDSERDNFAQCGACRWWYDMRDFKALMYHAYRDHAAPRREIAARSA